MPVAPAEVVPLLAIPPPPAPLANFPMELTTMAAAAEAANRPLLVTPPENVETSTMWMPSWPPETVPALVTPPPNVSVLSIEMAFAPLARISLLLSIWMPPSTVPVLTMPPLWKVLLLTTIPPTPMVPILTTLPLKVVWLISHSLVVPVNVPGALVKGRACR